LDNFERIVRKSHKELSDIKSNSYKYRSIQSAYLNFLIDKTLQYVTTINNEINIYIALSYDLGNALGYAKNDFFDQILKKELQKRGMTGSAFIGKTSLLKSINGNLHIGDKRVHSILMMDFGAEEVTPELLRAYISDKVYFPDHIGSPLLRDKRNLAILYELALKGKFASKDNELVLRSIPWTVTLKENQVIYKEKKYELLQLLRKQKDQFVIKIANGFKGDSVYIGKSLSTTEWENAIKESMGSEAFIAQKFSDSITYIAPNIANEWVPHKLVWGSFGFGETYGGVVPRMVDVKIDNGVINAARGAMLAIVYEHTN